MGAFYIRIALLMWAVWLGSWIVAAFWRGRPTVQAPRGQYRLQFMVVMVGFYLLVWPAAARGWPVLWPVGPVLGWSMEALTLAGILFAWWARIHLGALWSGGVERMAEHRVVDTGPYALVRHPIYTGLIACSLAMAVLQATPLAFLGLALYSVGFALKARVEERFLEAEIGGYDAYRARVPMLVPFTRWSL